MPTIKRRTTIKLPARFDELVAVMSPRAIVDDAHHQEAVEMIDRLMASGRLTAGQASYMETLVQLVRSYESTHDAIESEEGAGLETLRHLVAENGMNASQLARLLGMHASMGSKILKGERSLTVDHIKKLSRRFKVGYAAFIA